MLSPQYKLDLNRAAESLRRCFHNASVPSNLLVNLILALDVSRSYSEQGNLKFVRVLLERLVSWSMVLDPNGSMAAYKFSAGDHFEFGSDFRFVGHTFLGHINRINRFVMSRMIASRWFLWRQDTNYSYILERCLGRAVKLQKAYPIPIARRSVILIPTDGDCDARDHSRTMDVLRASRERGDEVFVLFILAGHSNTEFLRKITDEYANCGIAHASDLEYFTHVDDEKFNRTLLIPKLVEWLKAA